MTRGGGNRTASIRASIKCDAYGWPVGDFSYTRDGLTHDVVSWYVDSLPGVRLGCRLSPNDKPDAVRKPTTCFACLRARRWRPNKEH